MSDGAAAGVCRVCARVWHGALPPHRRLTRTPTGSRWIECAGGPRVGYGPRPMPAPPPMPARRPAPPAWSRAEMAALWRDDGEVAFAAALLRASPTRATELLRARLAQGPTADTTGAYCQTELLFRILPHLPGKVVRR